MLFTVAAAGAACNRDKLDADGDGFTVLTNDCDDTDPNVNPDAVEVCYNGKDDNCNGVTDEEGATSGRVWYADLDSDGYGDASITIEACAQPEFYAENKWDCNESDPTINPGAVEVCDYVDNDCDGQVDEATSEDAPVWFPDRDGDGYGDASSPLQACEAPAGYTADSSDCGDLDPLQNPDATEDCRTDTDDDCDGTANGEGAYGCTNFYADLDGDGFPGTAACLCVAAEPFTAIEATDCNDERADIYPDAPITNRFATEDCNADSRVDTDTADHELNIGLHTSSSDNRTFAYGVLFLDATGDGVDDMVAGTASGAPRLVSGPLTEHLDLTAPLATLPDEGIGGGNLSLRRLPDQDGDGLDDILQVTVGNDYYPSPIGARAFSGAARGDQAFEDALWSIDEDSRIADVRVLPASGDEPAVLLMTMEYAAEFTVWDLSEAGSPPSELGVVSDPLITGGAVTPVGRMDWNGDGVDEFILQQDTSGFLTQHRWTGGSGVYRPTTALAVMERYTPDDPFDLEPVHVVYGWHSLGQDGAVVTRDVDEDGHPDLVAAEASNLLAPSSGAVWVFTSDSMEHRARPYSLMTEADAIYSAAEGDTLTWVRETADLDGDGDPGVMAVGFYGAHWWLDRFPLGHHAMDTFARPIGDTTTFHSVGDANADGMDDLLLFDGDQTLRFFWGEAP